MEKYIVRNIHHNTNDLHPKSTYALLLTAVLQSNVYSVVYRDQEKTSYFVWQALLEKFESVDSNFAAAQEIKLQLRNIRLSKVKNLQNYLNTFENCCIRLRNMIPSSDLTDEEAATAFMRGLKGSKFKWLIKQCSVKR